MSQPPIAAAPDALAPRSTPRRRQKAEVKEPTLRAWHPYASLFPMFQDEDLQQLADDIRVNGQQHPIWVDETGAILDGRNRSAACHLIGLDPETKTFFGSNEDKLAFVLSNNIHRRHLDTSQRAMVAAKLLPIYEEQAKARQIRKPSESDSVVDNCPEQNRGRAKDKAGEALNVSGKSVVRAAKVIRHAAPEIVEAVEAGKLAVSAAAIVADMPPDEQRALAAQVLSGKKPHSTHSSGDYEWYTPAQFIASARLVMGEIDLDPASSETANQIVQAVTYYDVDRDGLQQSWRGRVWINPPTEKSLIGPFTDKLCREYQQGNVEEAVLLVNNTTETEWFQAVAREASAVCLPVNHIHFRTPNCPSAQSPLQGRAFLYFGTKVAHFIGEFSQYGVTFLAPPPEIHSASTPLQSSARPHSSTPTSPS